MNWFVRRGCRLAYSAARLYWFLTRPKTRGAYVAVWNAGRLLCLQNPYRDEVTVPSGGIWKGETPRAAAARELREEVGILLSPARLAYAASFTRPHDFRIDTGFFFEIHLSVAPELDLNPWEVTWARFLHPDSIRNPQLSPLVDAYLDWLDSGDPPEPIEPD